MENLSELARLYLLTLCLVFTSGCVSDDKSEERIAQKARLSAQQAAELAAELANDECHRLYRQRPFNSEDYTLSVRNDRWHWGRLDPAGHAGLSATVDFALDGSRPEVTVYFSLDSNATQESP